MYPYQFEAEIERFGVGKTRKIWYQVLMLPSDLQAALPFQQYPRLRVEGEIADVPINNAFIPTGDGRHYVIVGPDVREGAGVGLSDRVIMRFKVADQDAVDVPETLAAALEADSALAKHWMTITSGRKRSMAQHVASAKTEPTRQRRLKEVREIVTEFDGRMREWQNARKARK